MKTVFNANLGCVNRHLNKFATSLHKYEEQICINGEFSYINFNCQCIELLDDRIQKLWVT